MNHNKLEAIGIHKIYSVCAYCIGHTNCNDAAKIFHASKDQIYQMHGLAIPSDIGLIFFQKENTVHGAEELVGNVKWLRAAYP